MSPARALPTRYATLGTGQVWSDVTRPIPHFGTDVPYSNKVSNQFKEQNVSDSSPIGAVADKAEPDPVNHPSHYTAYKGVEVIELTEQMNFCRGNAVKYIARAGLKDPGKEVEDLEKARWYIDREIARLKAA